jgi:hypothetical protein
VLTVTCCIRTVWCRWCRWYLFGGVVSSSRVMYELNRLIFGLMTGGGATAQMEAARKRLGGGKGSATAKALRGLKWATPKHDSVKQVPPYTFANPHTHTHQHNMHAR